MGAGEIGIPVSRRGLGAVCGYHGDLIELSAFLQTSALLIVKREGFISPPQVPTEVSRRSSSGAHGQRTSTSKLQQTKGSVIVDCVGIKGLASRISPGRVFFFLLGEHICFAFWDYLLKYKCAHAQFEVFG